MKEMLNLFKKTKITEVILLLLLVNTAWAMAPHNTKITRLTIAKEIDTEVTKELSSINSLAPTPKVYLSNAKKPKPVTVIIDPGHGGKDPGAVGVNHIKEKDVVLAIAQYLQKDLKQQYSIKAILTRHSDYFIPLRERLRIARRGQGDLFISIHADDYMNSEAQGASIYALSLRGATSEAARFLARKENESELGHVIADKNPVLQSVLVNLTQNASISTSLDIGYEIIRNLDTITKLHHSTIGQAAFVVLKEPEIPSLLVETGFLSNFEEELKLCTPKHQKQIAAALAYGINNYFINHPKFMY
jgi:N-acetylmuramoyl-L-alanine amidase